MAILHFAHVALFYLWVQVGRFQYACTTFDAIFLRSIRRRNRRIQPTQSIARRVTVSNSFLAAANLQGMLIRRITR
jgi:hypothetical protein